MYDEASELYINLQAIFFDEYYEVSDTKRKKIEPK